MIQIVTAWASFKDTVIQTFRLITIQFSSILLSCSCGKDEDDEEQCEKKFVMCESSIMTDSCFQDQYVHNISV